MPKLLQPPGGEWTFNAAIFLIGGAAGIALAASQGNAYLVATGLWFLVLGSGIWRKQPWTRWAATVTSMVIAIWGFYLWVKLGFAWSRALTAACASYGAWAFWHELVPDDAPDTPMISLVLLLKQPKYLEAAVLAEVLKSAWNLPFEVGQGDAEEGKDDKAKPFVVGESPLFMVSAGDAMFVVHNHGTGYFSDVDKLAEKIPDLRQRKLVTDQQAWLSVDCIWTADGTRESQYPRIARAIAELADDTVLGLFQPETDRLVPWEESLEARLRKGENLDDLFRSDKVPVVQVSDDDPRMKAAVAEARHRWPEFAAAFKARQPGGHYAVKAPITREDNTEFIWLEVIGLEPEYIHGTLANDPVDLGGLKIGDQVEVPLSDLNDWGFYQEEGDEPVGLFTSKVLAEAYKQQADAANKPA